MRPSPCKPAHTTQEASLNHIPLCTHDPAFFLPSSTSDLYFIPRASKLPIYPPFPLLCHHPSSSWLSKKQVGWVITRRGLSLLWEFRCRGGRRAGRGRLAVNCRKPLSWNMFKEPWSDLKAGYPAATLKSCTPLGVNSAGAKAHGKAPEKSSRVQILFLRTPSSCLLSAESPELKRPGKDPRLINLPKQHPKGGALHLGRCPHP